MKCFITNVNAGSNLSSSKHTEEYSAFKTNIKSWWIIWQIVSGSTNKQTLTLLLCTLWYDVWQ